MVFLVHREKETINYLYEAYFLSTGLRSDPAYPSGITRKTLL